MKLKILLLSSLVLGACAKESVNTISQNEVSSTVSVIEEAEMNDKQTKALNALAKMQFEVPADWNKSETPINGWELASPDYQVTKVDGAMCPEIQGTKIVISVTSLQTETGTINDIMQELQREPEAVSKIREVNVDNNPAIEYVWSWECSPTLITRTNYNGVQYSISLKTDKFSEYSSQYHGIIDSIRFETD